MIVKGLIEFVMTRFVTEGLNAMFHHNSTREEAIKRRFEWCEGLECASIGFIVRIEGFYVTYCYVIAGRLQSPEESCRSFVLKRLNRLGEQHARKPPTFSGFFFHSGQISCPNSLLVYDPTRLHLPILLVFGAGIQ